MKKVYYFFIVFFIVILLLFLFSLRNPILDTQVVFTEIVVNETPGLNLDSDALYFGQTTPGGSAKRALIFENSYPFDVTVYFQINGSLSSLVWTRENPVKIPQNSSKDVIFHIGIPKNTTFGTYNGTITAVFKRR
jgi:hypothetical protein